MAPRARLLFLPAPPAVFSPPLHSPPSTESQATKKPLPPIPPLRDVEGPFSLLPGGGVQVGERVVSVPRGIAVERIDPGLDAGAVKGLRWMGSGDRGVYGEWQLFLLGATEGDLLAVHRILLGLPPDAAIPPTPREPQAPIPPPGYRNSVVVYDEATRSVLAVLSLSPQRHVSHCPPPALPPPIPHPHFPPTPTYHPSAASFTAYIDHVSNAIHPSPTPETLCREQHAARAEIERLAAEETAEDELRLPAFELVAVGETQLSLRAGEQESDEDQPRWRDEHRRLEKGFQRLDLEMELASPRTAASPSIEGDDGAAISTRRSRPPSSWTVSSFATFGTERFVTADEGESAEPGETSRRSSFSHGDELGTLRGSRTDVPAPPTPVAPPAPFDPGQTLTNGNAVLLDFLGAPSVVLSMSTGTTGTSGPTRVTVTAHPLSSEQVSEMEERGEIQPATLDVPAGLAAESQASEGWWAWLASLVGGDSGSTTQQKEHGWLGWLALPSLFSSAAAAPASPTAAGARKRAPRSAGGEATSRLSVFHIDEAGVGRRAFVTTR